MKLLLSFFLLLLLSACQTTANRELADESDSAVVNAFVDEEGVDEQLLEIDNEEGLTDLVEEQPSDADKPALAAGYDNIWLKLAEGFVFDVPNNARIAKQRNYYLKHPNYLKKVSKRAEPFLYLIVKQIEAKNLPLELALLPVVESTFDPFAYSQSNASGLWQFMPVTGKRFGLKQDWWYDGRRDVYASTEAALRYMQILHKYLDDDWLHAVAAYNSGEGRVKKAVRKNKKRNKPVDYWNLSLPKETENYVPKLLALVDILRNHKKYGIELPVIPNKQALSYIDTGSQLDLAYAAELAELSVAEIQLLNPAFNHWATSPDGPHKLLVPTRIAGEFTQKLSNSDKNKRIRWSRYKVHSGDTLSVIAQKNDTTSNVLRQINDINGSFIKVGQPLLIPIASKSQQNYLYSQAQRFDRRQAKNAKTKQTLRLGQQLTIWKNVSRKSTTRRVTYKVRPGDSLGVIAAKFNVKSTDLVRWNKLHKQKYIHPGQKLKVYVNVRRSRT